MYSYNASHNYIIRAEDQWGLKLNKHLKYYFKIISNFFLLKSIHVFSFSGLKVTAIIMLSKHHNTLIQIVHKEENHVLSLLVTL